MKIYSWNILFRNKELDRAFEFIRTTDFDIFCLQEVPADFLTHLKTLPVAVVAIPETDRVFKGKHSTQYVVLLSRYPIRTFEAISLPYYDLDLPLRGKLFTWLMFALRLWAKGLGNRHAAHADIETPTGIVRVFNLHLTLTQPAWRLEEFERAMTERDTTLPAIVCGDFNILESPKITLLNWLLGGSIDDVFLWMRERTHIEKRFVSHELSNPLRGKNTHPLSRSQLDHILVSHSLTVKDAQVIPDRIGSDHHPIRVEIE